MIKLEKEQIIAIHSLLVSETGGMDGIRDEKLLDSALQLPFQTFAGEELYPTIQRKAACFCFGLVNSHAFYEGHVIIRTKLEKPSKIKGLQNFSPCFFMPAG